MINAIGYTNAVPAQIQVNMEKEQAQTDAFAAALDSAMKSADLAQMKKACDDFESYFISTLFKSMQSTVTAFTTEKKSPMESTFTDMLYDEYAKNATQSGGIGLSAFMLRQLAREQGIEE